MDALSRAKASLERSLDEAEENTERERKAKAEEEKGRKKAEAELKASQAQVAELEQARAQLAGQVSEREAQSKALAGQVEEASGRAAASQRRSRELEQQLGGGPWGAVGGGSATLAANGRYGCEIDAGRDRWRSWLGVCGVGGVGRAADSVYSFELGIDPAVSAAVVGQ